MNSNESPSFSLSSQLLLLMHTQTPNEKDFIPHIQIAQLINITSLIKDSINHDSQTQTNTQQKHTCTPHTSTCINTKLAQP